jgi:hypothetical protein
VPKKVNVIVIMIIISDSNLLLGALLKSTGRKPLGKRPLGSPRWKRENKIDTFVRFEVLAAVVMKSSVFWDTTPCRPLEVN